MGTNDVQAVGFWSRCVAEFVGTFALVFAGTGAMIVNDVTSGAVTHVGVALTFGLVVMVMIHALGDVSGAHLNPAVTLGFWVARRFPGDRVVWYIVAQVAGAITASGVLRVLFLDHPDLGATLHEGPWWQAATLEVLITLMLMFVILSVSAGAQEKGIMAGAAIGGTVALAALFAGPICGASMNPARSLGPALLSGQLESLWIYLVAPIIGAIMAVGGCRCVQAEGCCPTSSSLRC